MSSQYTVNGLGLPGPNPWSIILTGWGYWPDYTSG